MARGLSDLQKWMLVRAIHNQDEQHRQPLDLFRNEVRAGYYGFPVRNRTHAIYEGFPQRRAGTYVGEPMDPRHDLRNCFAKSEIPNYAKASLAINRAIDRLARRGLVEGGFVHGFRLTDEGRQIARLLAALAVDTTAEVTDKV